MSFLRIELRDDSEPRPVEEEHRVEVVVAAGPGEGGGVGLELAVHAGPAVPGVAVHGAVHGLHLQDALDGVPDEADRHTWAWSQTGKLYFVSKWKSTKRV